MRLNVSALFGLLVACQAAHSIEEYGTGLYDVFAPARFVSGLLGLTPPTGFAIANLLIALFGLWCWLARVLPRRGAWRGYAWFWALIETANGLGHLLLAAIAGGYFPGFATAPLLLGSSAALALALRRGTGEAEQVDA